MSIAVSLPASGGRNFTVHVSGVLAERQPLEQLAVKLPEGPLRLTGATWLIQEKMGLKLWWGQERISENLLLVMESRNAVSYLPFVQPPAAWDRELWLESFGNERVPDPPACFRLVLDFDR